MFRASLFLPVFASGTATTTKEPHLAVKGASNKWMVKGHGLTNNEVAYLSMGGATAHSSFPEGMYFVRSDSVDSFTLNSITNAGADSGAAIAFTTDINKDWCGKAKIMPSNGAKFLAYVGLAGNSNAPAAGKLQSFDATGTSDIAFGQGADAVCAAADDVIRLQMATGSTPVAPVATGEYKCTKATTTVFYLKSGTTRLATTGGTERAATEKLIAVNFTGKTGKDICTPPASTAAASSAYRTSAAVAGIVGMLFTLL
jgi:hypothetical protein